jgi:hypothetical protein
LKIKERQKEEEAMYMEDTQRFVTEMKCSKLYCIWFIEIIEKETVKSLDS